jgi:hypothetical protein
MNDYDVIECEDIKFKKKLNRPNNNRDNEKISSESGICTHMAIKQVHFSFLFCNKK